MRHADLIRAVLDGKQLEYKAKNKEAWTLWTVATPEEIIRALIANLDAHWEYRVYSPPPPDVERFRAIYRPDCLTKALMYSSLKECLGRTDAAHRVGIEKIVYDGATFKPKSVEIAG